MPGVLLELLLDRVPSRPVWNQGFKTVVADLLKGHKSTALLWLGCYRVTQHGWRSTMAVAVVAWDRSTLVLGALPETRGPTKGLLGLM